MLEITEDMLRAVFYLYRTEEEANAADLPQGTGFALLYKGRLFGVTNWHVACETAPVVRHNREWGAPGKVLAFDPSDWFSNVTESDLAVVELPRHEHDIGRNAIPIDNPRRDWSDVKVGDGAFMLGLFVDHKGHEHSAPIARFGRVSMLASENHRVAHRGREYECYLVDMPSRSGFSGSPVFRYTEFTRKLSREEYGMIVVPDEDRPTLLGVHFAQFMEEVSITGVEPAAEARYVVSSSTRVRSTSGMCCVVPVWKLRELLDEFIAKRNSATDGSA
jgi:hypothetical protein